MYELIEITNDFFTIYFQHISVRDDVSQPNTVIHPETVLGTIYPWPGNDHLHLEIRIHGKWSVNPTLAAEPSSAYGDSGLL